MENTTVPEKLLDILACPACDDRPRVELKDGAIFCPKCGRIYPVENGIPVMLVEKAVTPDQRGN